MFLRSADCAGLACSLRLHGRCLRHNGQSPGDGDYFNPSCHLWNGAMSFSALIRVTRIPTRMEEEAHGRKIIATFCLCDDLLKAIEHQESAFAQQLNDAEAMTIALVAASCFQGRHGSLHARATRLYPWQAQQKPLQPTPASTQSNLGDRLRPLGTPLESPGCPRRLRHRQLSRRRL